MVTPNTISSLARTFAFIGGLVGLVTFLFVGLLPAIVYGGAAGGALGTSIVGGPVDASRLAQALQVFGMVIGLLGAAGVFVVLGAALGAGVYAVVRPILAARTKG